MTATVKQKGKARACSNAHFFLLLFAAVALSAFPGGRWLVGFSQTTAHEFPEARGAVHPTTPEEAYESAVNYLRSGQTDKAIESLSSAVRREPKSKAARCGLGQAYVNAGHLAEAVEQFRACAELDPNDPQVQYNLGQAYLQQAWGMASKILETDDTSPYARRIFAENYEGKNDVPEAETQYRLALAQEPNAVDLRLGLGNLYVQKGDLAQAREQFQQAVNACPTSLSAHYKLAEVTFDEQDFSVALTNIRWILKTNPRFLFSRSDFPELHLASSASKSICTSFFEFASTTRKDPALVFIERPCVHWSTASKEAGVAETSSLLSRKRSQTEMEDQQLTPEESHVVPHCSACGEQQRRGSEEQLREARLIEVGRCAYEMAQYQLAYRLLSEAERLGLQNVVALYWFQESARRLAERSFERIKQLDPDSYLLHLLAAQTWEEQQQPDLAIREYKAAIDRRPEASNIHLLLGHLYWRWRRYDEALPELLECLRLDPQEPGANYLVGDIWVQEEQPEKAVPYLRRALALRPRFLNAKASLGTALGQLKQYQAAIDELTEVAPADADGSIHYQLAELYQKLGRSEEAQNAFAAAETIRARRRHVIDSAPGSELH